MREHRKAKRARAEGDGAAVVKCFARVKLDARVVKLLACLDLGGELDRIAMRGAPLRLPGLSIARNPQQCVAKIEEIASTGVNHMILCVTDPAIVKGFTQKDVDVPDAKTQLRLIHDEVMPAFAA